MKMMPVFATVLLLGCVEAQAGGATNVTITKIEAESQGHFFFYLSSNISGSPACVDLTTYANRLVVDGSTAAGKVVVSMVEVAYALGKTVTLAGNNQCDVHANIETISDIFTTN